MPITMTTPAPDDVVSLAETLDLWQLDGGPLQLHPGDLGWFSMRGIEATASAMRVWLCDGRPVAIGLLDGDDLLPIVRALTGSGATILVGHNPALEQALFHLDAAARLHGMSPASIAQLGFDGRVPPTDPGAATILASWMP